MHVSFVISNPGHHAKNVAPVARGLTERGHRVTVASLCELRGFRTAAAAIGDGAIEVRRVLPLALRSSPDVGWARSLNRRPKLGRWARGVAIGAFLRRRLARSIPASTEVLVIPNDVAFPYDAVVGLARRRGTPFLLLQEGIRFPQPGVASDEAYGRAGAAAIAAWGESSADYFRDLGVQDETIEVTGNPGLDELDPGSFREAGDELLAELGVTGRPLLYLSNPIETQGLASAAEKLDLFRRFLTAAAPRLAARRQWLVAKLHPSESEAEFRRIAVESGFGKIVVTASVPLHPLLAAAGQAVVLASTVGVEAICFGLPLGVLEIPGHGFVFDYVASGAARGLRSDHLDDDLEALLGNTPDPERTRRYLERALAGRRGSSERIVRLIERLGEAAP